LSRRTAPSRFTASRKVPTGGFGPRSGIMPYKYRNLSSHADTMKKKAGKIVSSKYPKAQRTGKMQNPALPPVKE